MGVRWNTREMPQQFNFTQIGKKAWRKLLLMGKSHGISKGILIHGKMAAGEIVLAF
jgi:hypothetical protein